MTWRQGLRTTAMVLRDGILCVLILPVLCLGACVGGPLALVATLETRYAPGYSERRFHEVAVGQSRDEVLARLGEPLRKGAHDSTESWSYSESPNDTHYWCRVVIFDGTGRVSRVHAELYAD
jgi:outer membrane protein assembly factor BamE (lipoprotein component of BamABCDE complex)